jgi:hypothetical protein
MLIGVCTRRNCSEDDCTWNYDGIALGKNVKAVNQSVNCRPKSILFNAAHTRISLHTNAFGTSTFIGGTIPRKFISLYISNILPTESTKPVQPSRLDYSMSAPARIKRDALETHLVHTQRPSHHISRVGECKTPFRILKGVMGQSMSFHDFSPCMCVFGIFSPAQDRECDFRHARRT